MKQIPLTQHPLFMPYRIRLKGNRIWTTISPVRHWIIFKSSYWKTNIPIWWNLFCYLKKKIIIWRYNVFNLYSHSTIKKNGNEQNRFQKIYIRRTSQVCHLIMPNVTKFYLIWKKKYFDFYIFFYFVCFSKLLFLEFYNLVIDNAMINGKLKVK